MASQLSKHAALEHWFIKFREYVGERKAGFRVTGDWPKLLEMYEQSASLYEQVVGNGDDWQPNVAVVIDKQGNVAEHVLLIAGIEVDHEFTVIPPE